MSVNNLLRRDSGRPAGGGDAGAYAPLTVFDDKFIYSWKGGIGADGLPLNKKGEPIKKFGRIERDPIAALGLDYATDAHCAMYFVEGAEAMPRIAKKAVREGKAQPLMGWIIIDVDTPNHVNLDDAPLDWIESIIDAELEIPELSHCLRWASRGGYKYAWPLAPNRRYDVERGEDYLRMFIDYLVEHGLDVDAQCKDWTRFMRMPRTVRDGEFQDYAVEGIDGLRPLDWSPPRQPQSGGRVQSQRLQAQKNKRGYKKSLADVEKQRAREALAYVDADCNYTDWIAVGTALKTEFHENGWPVWRDWSARADSYPGDDEAREKWDSLGDEKYEGGATLGTVYWLAKEGGWPGEITIGDASEIMAKCHAYQDFYEPRALHAAARLYADLGREWADLRGRVSDLARLQPELRLSDWEKKVSRVAKEIRKLRRVARFEAEQAGREADGTITICNFTASVDQEGEVSLYRRSIGDIVGDIFTAAGDWPRLYDNVLFARSAQENEPRYFTETADLFAWLEGQGHGVEWTGRDVYGALAKVRPVGRSEVMSELVDRIPPAFRYHSVETIPHVPPVRGSYYFDRELPAPTGKALADFLSLFNPETAIDGALIEALLLSGMAGLLPGKRPAFVITSDHGRSAGKSSTAKAIAQVYGGAIGIKAQDGWGQLQQRLLDPSTANKRFCFIDNLKNRLSSAEFESAITDRTINGKRMYVGDGERVNLLTWIFTANTPSLSNDLAARSVVIKIGNPDHAFDFDGAVDRFLRTRRDELLADIKARLEEPATGKVERHVDRWQAWQDAVLSRFENADEIACEIKNRRKAVDDDAARADEWYRVICEIIEKQGLDPATVKTVIPSAQVVKIARQVEHDPLIGYQKAWNLYRDVQGVGPMRHTKKYASSPKGLLWVGRDHRIDDGLTPWENAKKRRSRRSPSPILK